MEKIHINSSKLSDVIEKFDKPTKIYIPLMMKDNAVYLTELDKYRREQDNITVVLVRVE